MIDPWRFEHQICGCGSEWCWSEVSKKLFVFIAGMFRRRTWFSFDDCHVQSKISWPFKAGYGWHEPIPCTTTCVFYEFPSRLPSMMSWVIGMKWCSFHVFISQIQPNRNEGANMDHVYSIHLANDAVSLTFFVWAHIISRWNDMNMWETQCAEKWTWYHIKLIWNETKWNENGLLKMEEWFLHPPVPASSLTQPDQYLRTSLSKSSQHISGSAGSDLTVCHWFARRYYWWYVM